MNLKEIREAIADALKFDPNSKAYKDRIGRRVSSVYMELMGDNRWSFLEEEVSILAYADEAVTADFTNGSYYVSVTSSSAKTKWVGHKLVAPDGESYRIGRVGSGGDVFLLEPYGGATSAGASATIYYEQYPVLYQGGAWGHVLSVTERNRLSGTTSELNTSMGTGGLRYVSAAEEHGSNLNPERVGKPTSYLLEQSEVADHWSSEVGVTVTLAAGGALTVGQEYRYLYATFFGNEPQERSDIVSVTTTAGNQLAVLSFNAHPVNHGAEFKVYRDSGDGVFRLISTVPGDRTSYYDDGSVNPAQERYNDLGPFEFIRFWPRPSVDSEYKVRMTLQPQALIHDMDVPRIPVQYQRLLVHLVVEELAAQAEGSVLSKFHGKKAAQLLSRMRRRFLTRTSSVTRRGAWDPSGVHRLVVMPKITMLP